MCILGRKSNSGNILLSLFAMLGLTSVIVLFTQLSSQRTQIAGRKIQNTRLTLNLSSGIETFLIAYRFAELKYLRALQNCGSVEPFYKALKTGSGCSTPVSVFNSTDTTLNAGVFSYVGACTIGQNTSTCSSGIHEVVSIGHSDASEAINLSRFRFSMIAVQPEKQLVEFLVTYEDALNKSGKFSFAVRSALENSAHLEQDGRVTQQNPDPLSPCPGEPWANYLLYNSDAKRCIRFVELGGGTGLGYYNERYFGFRPADGQVIDLNSVSAGESSYLVDVAGAVGGVVRFPSYSRSSLVNVDDITLIDDQVYYVANSGFAAHIGALDENQDRIRVCELGTQGWAQSYSGISAMSWSDPLLPTDSLVYESDRVARFFLKTDGGDLLSAVVVANPAGDSFSCFVVKDAALQEIEFKRTLGFERTAHVRPYYVY